jgi:Anti-sigma-K factor rskA
VTGDDDRIAYLAGEAGAPLDAEQRADLDELRALLADPSAWAEPTSDLEDRIVSAVAAEPVRRPEPDPARALAGRPHHRRRFTLIAGLAAAAVAIVVGIAVGLAVNGTKHQQQFKTALAATSLAPGASGDATLTQTNAGWHVRLHVTGLPRLDNGRFYQAWLKNRAGILVPIGTFNQGPNVTLWAGVSPVDFPALTITQQVANGNPASSGKRVLVGTISPSR